MLAITSDFSADWHSVGGHYSVSNPQKNSINYVFPTFPAQQENGSLDHKCLRSNVNLRLMAKSTWAHLLTFRNALQAQLRCYKREAPTPSIWNPALQGTSLSYTPWFSPKHLYLLTLDTELDPKRILQLPRWWMTMRSGFILPKIASWVLDKISVSAHTCTFTGTHVNMHARMGSHTQIQILLLATILNLPSISYFWEDYSFIGNPGWRLLYALKLWIPPPQITCHQEMTSESRQFFSLTDHLATKLVTCYLN